MYQHREGDVNVGNEEAGNDAKYTTLRFFCNDTEGTQRLLRIQIFPFGLYSRLPTPSAVAHMYALYVSFMAGNVARYSRSTVFLI